MIVTLLHREINATTADAREDSGTMNEVTSRRAFLTGRLNAEPSVARPPWAVAEFTRLCDGCGECVKSCPEHSLTLDTSGRPVMDFTVSGCDFCGDCLSACRSGALRASSEPWNLEAVVSGACLAVRGIVCRTCEDMCADDAIRFQLGLNGKSCPLIDRDSCTGCGFCAAPCPVGAIKIVTSHQEERAA